MPCVDNQFHGTHVAGIVAAQANTTGVTGVAPNVTLVPVKVCEGTEGYCYASAVVDGITYAADIKLDVINMSLFADDDELRASTQCKPNSDPSMRAMSEAINRAVRYATKQGVVTVVAAGNSDTELDSRANDLPGRPNGVAGRGQRLLDRPDEAEGLVLELGRRRSRRSGRRRNDR